MAFLPHLCYNEENKSQFPEQLRPSSVIARPVRTLVVAIRNTYLERTDSHGHKCPRNDNVIGRYTKFETAR